MSRAASRATTAMAILLIICFSVGSDARRPAVDHPRRAEALDQHTKGFDPEGLLQRHRHLAALGEGVAVSPSGAGASEFAAGCGAARSSAALSKDAAAAKTAPMAKAIWYPPLSAASESAPSASSLSVRAAARLARTARPSAPPIMNAVLTTPEARPDSLW